MIDDEDAGIVCQYKWYASYAKGNQSFYAKTTVKKSNGNRTSMFMHRILIAVLGGQFIDHANGDTLDNRKTNLRVCSRKENNRNRKLQRTNTTGYKGLKWHSRLSKWEARIGVDGKYKYLGLFKEKEDAARAYDKAAVEHYGEYAHLNTYEK